MPGSSLWLLPPRDHPLNSVLTSLIQHTSSHFHSPHLFFPHVTLTSQIDRGTYGSDPQAWLESIAFPKAEDVVVKLGALASEDVFVRKLYFRVGKDGVREIGKVSRKYVHGFGEEDVAERWVEEEYEAHLSLLYHDCPKIGQEEIEKVTKVVVDNGVKIDGEGDMGSWVGGRVVLVKTDQPIKEWALIAERKL